MREPFKYQKEIIDRAADLPYMMVQADCGTGKSLISGQTAIRKGKNTLIITPKNIMDDFKAELIADGVPEEDIFVYDVYKSHKDGYFEAFAKWLGGVAAQTVEKAIQEEIEEEFDDDVIF